MEQHTIWTEQLDAAKNIEVHFGTQNALRYLVVEKFIDFVEAAETDANFKSELPRFASEIRAQFQASDLSKCLETARKGPPITPGDLERQSRNRSEPGESTSNDQRLVDQAKQMLLGD